MTRQTCPVSVWSGRADDIPGPERVQDPLNWRHHRASGHIPPVVQSYLGRYSGPQDWRLVTLAQDLIPPR